MFLTKSYTLNIKRRFMGLFRRRGFGIIRFILFVIIAGVCLYLLLRGQVNSNIVS